MQPDVILETQGLTMRFGGLTAVKDFTAAIPRGGIVGLIGPNGAGKTTCFNMITGFYRPSEGRVRFEGQEITGMPPHRVCRSGIARTFQNIRLFGNETVLENVMIGAHLRQKTGWWQSILCLPANTREEQAIAAARPRAPAGGRAGGARGREGQQPALRGRSGGSRSPARSPPVPPSCSWTSPRPG